jgi:hypothetical protein
LAGLHSGRQASVVEPSTGSQNPLQHCAADVHAVPAAAQVPGIAQAPPAQWTEQQSSSLLHVAPSGSHVGDAVRASQSSALASFPKSPASPDDASGPASRDEASSMSSGPHAANTTRPLASKLTNRVLTGASPPRRGLLPG